MNETPALLWLNLDLRLDDNPALSHAAASGRRVIPVFVWAPDEEAPWAPGAASRWWLHRSLHALAAALEKAGSRLIVRKGRTAEALVTLTQETGARSVFWNRRYEPAGMVREQDVERKLRARGMETQSFSGNLLFGPGSILNSGGKPFRVFTPFWRTCVAAGSPAAPVSAPDRIAAPEKWPASHAVHDLGLEPRLDWAAGLRETWQPGEAGAQARFKAFRKGGVESYSTDRDRPGQEGTSRMSPHLHFGEISVRRVWHDLREAESYRRQLGWREFSAHLLFHFPDTAQQPLRPEFQRFPWRMDESPFKAWTRGKTGYPLIDAGMRELWRTGWMHNRVRMAVASFLVKHLLIPWQEGARWFWDTLVDADLANNTMGWQWSAGCGADAAPYFRIFNPSLQSEKFDPEGAYLRRWIPEFGSARYPAPIVDHASARLRALEAFSTIRRLAL